MSCRQNAVPASALKSPSRTINSADVTFYKVTPTSSKKGWYCASAFGAYNCKMYSDRSCSLSLRRQTLLPSGIQLVTQSLHITYPLYSASVAFLRVRRINIEIEKKSRPNEGLQKCLPLPEQTWLHLHLSRKASSLHSTQPYQNHDT